VVKIVGRERESEERWQKRKNYVEEGWFLADFGSDFNHPQAMKSTPIYRGWKGVILFTLRKNFSL